ncbi:MAG: DUF4337 domain-containing protein [Deltaproteobacteria bacterium]|nr:DUF4337 domain-containing protein [Deltaproteobacteria bacterium]
MAEQTKETWLQWVALTTTILAVAAAISSLKASSYSTRIQISTTRESNQWAYYQAKSIKEHSFRQNRIILSALELLENKSPAAQNFLLDNIKKYDGEIARYEKEKEDIKVKAEAHAKEQDVLKRHNGSYGLAVMLLQIAIMLSAVGALVKKKVLWYGGMALGAWGLIYMGNGFFLWF